MRLVSLNAWGGVMCEELVAWLPTVGADVVALQEVTRTPGASGWARFEDDERALPQRANLMEDVAAVLPDHDPWFAASDTGPVETAGRVHRQDFGLGLFVARRLPLDHRHATHVHGEYVDHGASWPHTGRPRVAQVSRFADRAASRFVTVAHLHGLRDTRGKADTPQRRRQAERLAMLIEQTREPSDLVIVCGDLNLVPGSETFAILSAIGLTDLVGEADTRTDRYTKPVRHASYLLVSDVDAVRHFEVLTSPQVSDHRALLLDI